MKPIKDCGWVEPDGTCGLPSNLTPECHIDACPRLAWFVAALLTRSERLCAALADHYGDDIPVDLILPIVELEAAIKKTEGDPCAE